MNSSNRNHKNFLTKEIVGVCITLFSILVLLILFTGQYIFGDLGKGGQSFLFGVFGLLSYPLAVWTLYLGIAVTTEKRWAWALPFTFAALGVLFFISCFIHAITSSSFDLTSYGSYLVACFQAGENGVGGTTFGGLILGLLSYPLQRYTTTVGACLIFALLALGCVGFIVWFFRAPEPKAKPEKNKREKQNKKRLPEPEGIKPYPYAVNFEQIERTLRGGNVPAESGDAVPFIPAQPSSAVPRSAQPSAAVPRSAQPAPAFTRPSSAAKTAAKPVEPREEQSAARPVSSSYMPEREPFYYHPNGSGILEPRNRQPVYDRDFTREEAKRILSRDWDGNLRPQQSQEPYREESAEKRQRRSQILDFMNQPGSAGSLDDARRTLFGSSASAGEGADSRPEPVLKLSSDPAELLSHSKEVLYPQNLDRTSFYKRNLIFDTSSRFNNRTQTANRAVRSGYKPMTTIPVEQSFSEAYEEDVNRMPYRDRPPKILAEEEHPSERPYTLRHEDAAFTSRENYLSPRGSSYRGEPSAATQPEPPVIPSEPASSSRPDYTFWERTTGTENDYAPRTGFATSFSAGNSGAVSPRNDYSSSRGDSNASRGDFNSFRSNTDSRSDLYTIRDASSRDPSLDTTRTVIRSDTENRSVTDGESARGRGEGSSSSLLGSVFSSGQNDTGRVSLDTSRASANRGETAFPRREDGRTFGRLGRDMSSPRGEETGFSRNPSVEEPINVRELLDDDVPPPATRVPDFAAKAEAEKSTEEKVGRGVFSMSNRELEQPKKKSAARRNIRRYVKPPFDYFTRYDNELSANPEEIQTNKEIIVGTLSDFHIDAEIMRVTSGPTVTRYDIDVPKGIQARKVASYDEEIARQLRVTGGVSIYPNYESGFISIEVPNKKRATVGLASILQDKEFMNAKPTSLTFAIGKDVEGRSICGSIAKMTHLLVAGSTGAGKSVFLNSLIISLIMRYSPEELRLILIDPKQVEFIVYDKLPHLMINEIITDANKVISVLNWAIKEMERRYTLFQQKTVSGKLVREIDEYNASLDVSEEKLPKIVLIVDELADLMLVAKKDIEDRIQRLTQKSRAAGIHLVIATQRPSVDVITGIIKSNLPTRIAFRVAQEVDSRTILDCSGAEKLLGNGDLLYKTASMPATARVQGAFLSSDEVQNVVEFIKANNEAYFDESVAEYLNTAERQQSGEDTSAVDMDGALDPVYVEALKYVVTIGQASISMLQRRCAVGYARAGKIIEWMESMGYISPFDGSKARKVLITKEEFEEKFGSIED